MLHPAHSNGHPQTAARPLHAEDAAALHAACWPHTTLDSVRERARVSLELHKRGRYWPYVGLYQGQVVGFGKLARWQSEVEICDLVVGPQWRSLGVGTAIIIQLLHVARQQDYKWVEIGVATANARASALYKRLGFTQRPRRRVLDLGNGPEPVIYASCSVHDLD